MKCLNDCLKFLKEEAEELCWRSSAPESYGCPSAVEFLRDWVNPNHPVIFRDAIKHWPAVKHWDNIYFREKLGNKQVTVAVTPTGYADAVKDDKFMLPEERCVSFDEFLNMLENPEEDAVHYIQKQNSNLTEEFTEILCDVECEINWASEALGKKPDAVNFWMGDQRSVTSMHRDHYENIYCVISGYKEFILHPPTDLPWIPYQEYPVATYHQKADKSWDIHTSDDAKTVPWIAIDPLAPDLNKFPDYKHAKRMHCIVMPGDALYLPSLWFHHVQQSDNCIAVNYWYDMEFDIKYVNYKFLEAIVNLNKHI